MVSSPNVVPNRLVRQCLPAPRTFFSSTSTLTLIQTCAFPSLNYTWINQDRKAVHLPAPTYIDYVMTWVQNTLDDESVFPTKSGAYICTKIANPFQHTRSSSQAKTFPPLSPPPSSTSTASFSVFLPTSITHITSKSSTFARSHISTHYLRISWLSEESMNCWS
jgi:hypothetical protein